MIKNIIILVISLLLIFITLVFVITPIYKNSLISSGNFYPCGGFVGRLCPNNLTCSIQENYPDAMGVCTRFGIPVPKN